jgi:hypothetical protein
MVSSFVFINYFIIIIVFVCNKQTVITAILHHWNRPKPPPPPRATSQTHRQHLIKQIWKIGKTKKNWVVAVTGREREPPRNPNRDPPRAHATPPHRNQCKPTKNPQQTHYKQPPWRSRFPGSLCSTQLASPRLRRHRLAAPHPASPSVATASSKLSPGEEQSERDREREKQREAQKKKKKGKKKFIILNSKIEYRKLKVKTCKSCFHFR